jgi:hypothetical protein
MRSPSWRTHAGVLFLPPASVTGERPLLAAGLASPVGKSAPPHKNRR